MPSNTALPSSARTTLSPRIVVPPKLDQQGNVIFRKGHSRPNSAHFALAGVRTAPPAPQSSLSHVVTVPQKLLDTVTAMKTSEHHGVIEGENNEGTSPTIASWPAVRTSRLLQSLHAQLLDADALGDSPALRAERLIQMLHELGEEMVSYKSIFHAFASEVQLLVTRLSDATQAVEESRSQREEVERNLYSQLRLQHVSMSKEIRTLQQVLEDRKAESEAVVLQADKLRSAQLEMQKSKRLLLQKEEEVTSSKRLFDQTELEYAKRNKELSDRMPQLEEEVRLAKNKADELHASNVRLSTKVTQLERQLLRSHEQHKTISEKLEETIGDLRSQNRRLSQSLQALRVIKHQVDNELVATQQRLEALEQEHKESLVLLTPRPEYSDRVTHLFIDKEASTVSKSAFLINRMHEAEEAKRLMAEENEMLRLSLTLPRADARRQAAPVGLCNVVIQCRDPAIEVPPYLQFKVVPFVTVKSLQLKDMVAKAKDLLDMTTATQSRTSKNVELHCCMLAGLIDTYYLSNASEPIGKYLAVPGGSVPMAVYEQFGALLLGVSCYSNHPIVETFGLILREELGCWAWTGQCEFVMRVVTGLGQLPQGSIAEYKALLRDLMIGFPEPFVITVQHQFAVSFGSDRMSAMRKNRRESRVSIVASPEDDDDQIVSSGLEPEGLLAMSLEPPFVCMLRRVYIAAVSCVYMAFDSALCQLVTGGKSRINKSTIIDEPTVIAALALVCPGTERATIVKISEDIFSLCCQQWKLETQMRDDPSAGQYSGPELGPAVHQVFLSGFTAHFYGSFAEYPHAVSQISATVADSLVVAAPRSRRKSSVAAKGSDRMSIIATVPSFTVSSTRGDDEPLAKPTKTTAPFILLDRMYRKVFNPLVKGHSTFVYHF